MGTLTLVRHGQASFGSADYDRLSELGQRQCRRLGEHFASRGQRFAAVLRGTLRRHEQSLAALREGLGDTPDEQVLPALDEYDSAALVRTVHPGELAPATTPEEVRAHFRLLREGLHRWIAGQAQPPGMPAFVDFRAGIERALESVREVDGDVLLVSSGGPIATAVTSVLGAPPATMIELNLRIRNSALTEFAVTRKRLALHSFNHLPHLEGPAFADWVTYT